MLRARELWTTLEKDSGKLLLRPVGTLEMGLPDELKDSIKIFEDSGTPYEHLTAKDLAKRWPQIGLSAGQEALFQKDGWVVLAVECLQALADMAEKFGARVLTGHGLESCDLAAKLLVTDGGERIEYDRLVLCCGPWTNQVLKRCGLSQLPLVVSCEQQTYFATLPGREAEHDWDSMPILLSASRDAGGDVYMVPHVKNGVYGVKVGVHREGQLMENEEHQIPKGTDYSALPNHDHTLLTEFPDSLDEWMGAAVMKWVRTHLPGVDGSKIVHHYRCRYTNVANDDGGFVVGRHPDNADVVLACAFNGEGFKFATAVGEMAADISLGEAPKVPEAVSHFDPRRLTVGSP
jgi:sarcosine oxidase